MGQKQELEHEVQSRKRAAQEADMELKAWERGLSALEREVRRSTLLWQEAEIEDPTSDSFFMGCLMDVVFFGVAAESG